MGLRSVRVNNVGLLGSWLGERFGLIGSFQVTQSKLKAIGCRLPISSTSTAGVGLHTYERRCMKLDKLNSRYEIDIDTVTDTAQYRTSNKVILQSSSQCAAVNMKNWCNQISLRWTSSCMCHLSSREILTCRHWDKGQYRNSRFFSRSLALHGKPERTSPPRQEGEDGTFQKKDWTALLTVPNVLTVTRMALTPYLGYLVLLESYQLACGVFLFAGITDLLDGWIARRYPSQSSPVGSFLDPLADKFLVSTLFITLSMVNLIPVPLMALVVARDISLIAAAFYVRIISLPYPVTFAAVFNISHQTAELKPTYISKLNTAVQLGLVVTTLAAPVFNFIGHPALHVLWYATAGTTIISGIGYIFAKGTFRVFKQRKQRPS